MSATHVIWHWHTIGKQRRAEQNHQRPCVLWFTGLSGSGKSTIAGIVEARLFELGHRAYLLDGDNVRHGLNRDLGFSDAERIENIRRIGEVARLFVDAGLIVLTAFISPFRRERQMIRELLEPGEFIEVFVDAPLRVCEQRDPKGLYRKARRGDILHFTGFDSPYEPPQASEILLRSAERDAVGCAEQVITYLREQGILGGHAG